MARFSFRQGIARRQQDSFGNPSFLQPSNGGSYIDVIVSPDPTVGVIAHFDVDYMITENSTKAKAWGPFTSGTDYWLYWDVDFISGELTRGYTTLAPTYGPNPPSSPAVDQHWFDTSQKVMKVWTGSLWVEKIRLFAVKYQSGTTLVHYPVGTQVALSGGRVYAGAILFDPDGKPLQKFQRNRRGQFITTETDLHSQFSRIANFRVEAAIVQGEAQENIPLHHCVAYSNYNELILARNTVLNRPAIGIAVEEMFTGEVRSFITKGFVTDEVNWDWSSYPVGTSLFVGPNGELITNPGGSVLTQQKIGSVVDKTTIFVDVGPSIHLEPPIGNEIVLHTDRDTGQTVARAIRLDLSDLIDVSSSIIAQDDDILRFNASSGLWEPESLPVGGGTGSPASGGPTELNDLTDVNAPSPSDREVLFWDAGTSRWVAGLALTGIGELPDVNLTGSPTLTDGDVLVYNQSAGEWLPAPAPTGNIVLGDITNVDLTGSPPPTTGDVITYNEVTGNWEFGPGANVCGDKPVPLALCAWGYSETFTSSTTWTVNHNAGTDKVIVNVYDDVGEYVIPQDVVIVDVNTVQILFDVAEAGTASLILMKSTP